MNECVQTAAFERECVTAAADGLLHGAVLAAGTTDGNNILRAWGQAVVEPHPRAMRTDAIFDVASLTKIVATASAAAVCIDRGLLDPEAPVREYLPELGPSPGGEPRVRDLAAHCSGYSNRKFDHCSPDQVVTMAIRAAAPWPAGECFEYSCRNFIILGQLIERLAKQGLAEFCAANVFRPLGMCNTCFGPLSAGLDRVVPSHAPAGTISDEQARQAAGPVGNAGLFATAADLSIFCRMMLDGGRLGQTRIFSETAWRWLTEPCSPPGLPRRSFGWDMRMPSECLHRPSRLSEQAIGHGGWTGQSLWLDPALGVYAIILTNRTHAQRGDNYDASCRCRARLADICLAALTR